MVDFRPFRGIRYDPAVAGNMADLICPPYDVISPEQEKALLARNQNNMVQLELAEIAGAPSADRYANAAAAFGRLLGSGALKRDESPSYYLLRQRFTVGPHTLDRHSIFGALRIEDLGKGVLPHEDTAPGPKQDRLALMEATEANFSPIMMLYRDSDGQARKVREAEASQEPVADFTVDGEQLTCWAISGSKDIAAVHQALEGQHVYIADGHHRYETSIVYRDKQAGAALPDAAFRFVMTCLIDFDDPGLLILPYYRVVHGLSAQQIERLKGLLGLYFVARPAGLPSNAAQLDAVVSTLGQGQVTLGVAEGGKPPMLLTPANDTIPEPNPEDPPERQVRSVEAWVLQEMLFRPVLGDSFPDHVAYIHEGQQALDMVTRGEGQMAFFIKGVPSDTFEAVVGAGIRLPRKSTYFHPKLPSGLVINSLQGTI